MECFQGIVDLRCKYTLLRQIQPLEETELWSQVVYGVHGSCITLLLDKTLNYNVFINVLSLLVTVIIIIILSFLLECIVHSLLILLLSFIINNHE